MERQPTQNFEKRVDFQQTINIPRKLSGSVKIKILYKQTLREKNRNQPKRKISNKRGDARKDKKWVAAIVAILRLIAPIIVNLIINNQAFAIFVGTQLAKDGIDLILDKIINILITIKRAS